MEKGYFWWTIFGLITIFGVTKGDDEGLSVGFYSKTCPSAEQIVRNSVAKAVAKDPGQAAGIIRLYFHDCIVGGCDGSILLDSIPGITSSFDIERHSPGNPLLRGFQIIDNAKSKLESRCPQTVSCSDILAFAARDSILATGGFSYAVPAGRRDGRVSNGSAVFTNVPPITPNITHLKQHFESRGLSLKDMVALSGAHSIGFTPCGAFSNRLYSFNETVETDPSLDPKFAAFLKTQCPKGEFDRTADLDNVTPNLLDVQFYENLKRKMGVLSSDQAMEDDPLTAATVRQYRSSPSLWKADFVAAMVKVGNMKVLTGTEGEIRRNCSALN
ncbi:peroxidase 5-like [Benincasa hispida]|uniref:peroxidase 5-like n=1 Tax=Benincasa hispida TaxID=102211 RepID=UPI001900C71A|nr:peroxidase 5-like [Benincasa hispida]